MDNTKIMSKEFEILVKQFVDTTVENYAEYAYAAGYLGSLAGQMLQHLSPEHKEMFLGDMRRALLKENDRLLEQLRKTPKKVRAL